MIILNIVKKFIPWNNTSYKIYQLYSRANKCHIKKKYFLSKFYQYKIYKKYHCTIAASAKIGTNLSIPHPSSVIIGEDVKIGNNVTIYQNVTCGQKNGLYPKIGDRVVIYPGSIIIGDIKIGNDAVIGAGSVVLNDVKDGDIVAGVPAKVIGSKK